MVDQDYVDSEDAQEIPSERNRSMSRMVTQIFAVGLLTGHGKCRNCGAVESTFATPEAEKFIDFYMTCEYL